MYVCENSAAEDILKHKFTCTVYLLKWIKHKLCDSDII